jgi:hypothetical protein
MSVTLESKLLDVIVGVDFVEAATALSMVLAAITFQRSGGNEDAVRLLFRNLGDNLPRFDERLH